VKTIPSALAAHYATGSLTTAYGLRITRTDGQVFGFTSHDTDETISGVLYRASQGLDASSLVLSAGMNVDNLELSTLDDGTLFTRFDVLSGVWRNAAFLLFVYNWATPTDGIDPQMAGSFGEAELRQNTIVIELRGLQQLLQQGVGAVSTKNCRARLGDSMCTVNLAPFTVTGTITSVTDAQTFRDSARAEAVDWFTEGEFSFTSGPLAGLVPRHKVKAYAANGTFTMALPFLALPAVGNTYSVIAGCRKRLAEDCATKFSNVLNFQAEPHRPLTNDLTKPATPSV
jgi:uncharacterized phage protein (TIGR02218 family)